MDLAAQARDLVNNLNNRLYASAYDIAWMARLRKSGDHAVFWPDLIDWLLEHQWSDGSWGGTTPYYHDRVLCTLSALIALKESEPDAQVYQAIRWGENYIWKNIHLLHHDLIELVGFELILPTLLRQAQLLQLNVPKHFCGYGRIRDSKLRLFPLEMLYDPGTSVAFSLEFLGSEGDPKRLRQVQGGNGGIANSPATTAYLMLQSHNHNQPALDYLTQVKTLPTGVPAFYPFRTFEIAWVLEHLSFGNLPLDELVSPAIWQYLQSTLARTGTGIDPMFGINDGDTTSVVLHSLALGGHAVDPMILHHFEEPGSQTFRTFQFERNPSVLTNVHALEALAAMPDYPDRAAVWERVIAMLLEYQLYQSYWIDKWHISPYYATSHVLIALIKLQEYQLVDHFQAVDWLLHTQRQDGSWGFFNVGTTEETAYALLALLHYHQHVSPVDTTIIKQGLEYLCKTLDAGPTFPELWIAKTLYTPENIVRAAILAALTLYEQTFGHRLSC